MGDTDRFPPIGPTRAGCQRCERLQRERQALVEEIAMHDRDHVAEDMKPALDAAIGADVQRLGVTFERALLEGVMRNIKPTVVFRTIRPAVSRKRPRRAKPKKRALHRRR